MLPRAQDVLVHFGRNAVGAEDAAMVADLEAPAAVPPPCASRQGRREEGLCCERVLGRPAQTLSLHLSFWSVAADRILWGRQWRRRISAPCGHAVAFCGNRSRPQAG